MVPTNDFLPFCPTDTGTNLESQSDYIADTDRTDGNQPGIASSKLNNKALRQGTYVVSQFAQFLSNNLSEDVLDDATPAKLLAQIMASIAPLPSVYTKYTSGSGTHNCTLYFFTASANATASATYTNNGVTYTVKSTISGALQLVVTGGGLPTSSGTLTKASGTGDATITFYAFRAPTKLRVKMYGGGGGGWGSGTSAGSTPTAGGATTFGTTLLSAGGGAVAASTTGTPAVGGASSLGSGPVGFALSGNAGGAGASFNESLSIQIGGPAGGGSAIGGGAGAGAQAGAAAQNAPAGCGGGGGGGSSPNTSSGFTGNSGAGGGGVDAIIAGPATTSYPYVIGAAGALGTAGASGFAGGNGAAGAAFIEENF